MVFKIDTDLKARNFTGQTNKGDGVKPGTIVEISDEENPSVWMLRQTNTDYSYLAKNVQFFIDWQTKDIIKERWAERTMSLPDFQKAIANLEKNKTEILESLVNSLPVKEHTVFKDIGWKTVVNISADVNNPSQHGILQIVYGIDGKADVKLLKKAELEKQLYDRTKIYFSEYKGSSSYQHISRLSMEMSGKYRLPGDCDGLLFVKNVETKKWEAKLVLENKRVKTGYYRIDQQSMMHYYNDKSGGSEHRKAKGDRAKYDRLMRLAEVLNSKFVVAYHTDVRTREDYRNVKFDLITKNSNALISDFMKPSSTNVCTISKSSIYVREADGKPSNFSKHVLEFAGIVIDKSAYRALPVEAGAGLVRGTVNKGDGNLLNRKPIMPTIASVTKTRVVGNAEPQKKVLVVNPIKQFKTFPFKNPVVTRAKVNYDN